MKNLLYKEFKLSIHPLFYTVPILSALILIPNWLYFIAMTYVFFITISNVFSLGKSNNEFGFCAMLPVKKSDIVKARFISIIVIELLQIITAVFFAILNKKFYPAGNFFLEPNAAFFGFVFIMYSIFNSIFMPMFYKTGYKIGIPVIMALTPALIFAAAVELMVLFVPNINLALDSSNKEMLIWKLLVLVLGIVIFIVSNIFAYRVSANKFEKVEIE